MHRFFRRGLLLTSLLVALAGFCSRLAAQQANPDPPGEPYSMSDDVTLDATSPASSSVDPADPQDPSPAKTTSGTAPANVDSSSKIDSPKPKINTDDDSAKQTKRILWIIPNFRSVSADTYLPPIGFKQKLWLATQESFDYSAVIWSGLIAGGAMANKSEPAWGQGASGYGNYFAHTFADGAIENYMVEAVLPTLTKEDPRYYTLGKGGFFKRTGYAMSRLVITRTDSGNRTPNLSELVGAGAAAGISNTYYFDDTNVWVKTYQRWLSQMIQDAVSNIAKEFWPDINRAVFHNKY